MLMDGIYWFYMFIYPGNWLIMENLVNITTPHFSFQHTREKWAGCSNTPGGLGEYAGKRSGGKSNMAGKCHEHGGS